MTASPARVRIDKWLWAARFFKTRGLARDAIEGGRVRLDGERVKPAKELQVGDCLLIGIGEYEWRVTVTGLSEVRGPAEQARRLYDESEDSRLRREELAARRRLERNPSAALHGRPTKRDRRALDRLNGGD